MKDSIQQKGDEVAIVIYDSPLPPKYFRLTKRFIKTLFVVFPVLFIATFIAVFIWGLGSRVKDTPVPKIPQVINESETKVIELESEVTHLRESNAQLTEKLANQPAVTTSEDPFLMVIKKPYGMQNFLSQNRVTLDQFQLIQDSNKTNLKFQIISATPETRVTGHVLVFMISDAGLMMYPNEGNSMLTQGVKYSIGEPFSVSRLRPTNAEFLHRLSGKTVKFVIYIFSREGDLLLIQETESFKVEAKS